MVLVVEKGVVTVGGIKVKQAILDTGAHNVLIGALMARLLGLYQEDRVIPEGYLLTTTDGGAGKWMPRTKGAVEIVLRPGQSEECTDEEDDDEHMEGEQEAEEEPPEEFRDSDSDMEGEFFDPPDWPPIGPAYMALEVLPKEEEAAARTEERELREEQRRVTSPAQMEPERMDSLGHRGRVARRTAEGSGGTAGESRRDICLHAEGTGIPIAEEDKAKTAFHGPYGAYEWNRMPFGLKNTSLLFQKVMDGVLQGLQGALCYIDDVIVFSATPKEHFTRLAETLEQIKGAGLTCHPKKCQFGHASVTYLGFEVKGGRLAIQQAKLEVLDKVAPPKDKSALRALLGFLNYYRKFVKSLSKRAAPLNKLLREEQKWEWGGAQKEVLKDLPEAVKHGAVLQQLRVDVPFVLYIDWSGTGMGAILSQQEGGEEKV
ncbi:unnamed protein product [Closterium sp. NIES-54]